MPDQQSPTDSAASLPAVFLDRDGTLIEDVGTLHSPEQIRLFPDTIKALRRLQENYVLIVITNQCCIANGEATADQVSHVHAHLDEHLRRNGITIRDWYVCPHRREDNCACIKPKPELVLQAQRKHGLDLTRSFVVGDHPHDALTANDLGVFGLYLLTGHGGRHRHELAADQLVFHRISDAAEWILSHPGNLADLNRQVGRAAETIRRGGVAAFPTETVYGLGADAFQPLAVEQIFRIKGRPHNNPLIVHISAATQLELLAAKVPETARRLAEKFWPGPLTIVLPKRAEVPGIVTAGHDTVAVRMPANPIALDLIRQCGSPLAAPSANRFTDVSPTTARHVQDQLGDRCPIVINGGACRVGLESTVLSLTGPTPVMLRPGGVPREKIEDLLGPVETRSSSPAQAQAPESPGMMPRHYAPATRLVAVQEIPWSCSRRQDIGLLLFKPSPRTFAGAVEVLSQSGDADEAAANFFAALRRLDALGLREIIAEFAPSQGLGLAINNRLVKAATTNPRNHE